MRFLLTALAYVASLALTAALTVVVVLVFAGPHSDLLPKPAQAVVVGLGWLAILGLPVLVARWVWQRLGLR